MLRLFTFFVIGLAALASARAETPSLWNRATTAASGAAGAAASAAKTAQEMAAEQFGRAVESGQNAATAFSALPSAMQSGYQTTADVLGPQVQGLTVLGLLGGTAGETAYAAGRVPGMAWRIYRFDCKDDAKLDRQILCPAISHFQRLSEIKTKIETRVALERPDARSLVDASLYLLETQQKIVANCASNSRITGCLNRSAGQAIMDAISNRSVDSLESYAMSLASGQGLEPIFKCIWPAMFEMVSAREVPGVCR